MSNVLNHPERVAASTRSRVEDVIRALGYRPDTAARSLAGGSSRTLGLVLTGLDHAFSLQLAHGVQQAAHRYGFALLVASVDNDDLLRERYVDHFAGARVQGVLLEPRAGSLWRHASSAVPSVVLDAAPTAPGVQCAVRMDNEMSGRLAVEHAARLGRRDLWLVDTADDLTVLEERRRGITRAIEATGSRLVGTSTVTDWRDRDGAAQAGVQVSDRAVDGALMVICMTDVIAAGVIDGLVARRVDVPGQVAVMGLDGNQLAWDAAVTMTTIEPYGAAMGHAGAELLLDELHGGAHRHRTRTVTPSLHLGQSTNISHQRG